MSSPRIQTAFHSTFARARRARWRVSVAGLGLALVCGGVGLPAHGHGDVHEAIESLSQQIAAAPTQAELYLRRGELHRAHQDWAAAAADYDRAGALAPELAVVDLARGEMLAQAGRLPEAREVLDRFLQRKPDASAGFAARGRVLAKLEQWRDAAADFSRAAETSREPDPALFLEQSHALRQDGQLDAAVRALDAGIARLGPLVTFVQPAIELEVKTGRFEAALQRVDTMLATAPRAERWHFTRGDILERAGRQGEAAEAYRAARQALTRVPPERRAVAAGVEFERKLQAALDRVTAGVTPAP